MIGTASVAMVVSALCVVFAIAGPSMLIVMSLPRAMVTYLLLASALYFVLFLPGSRRVEPVAFVIWCFLGTVLLAAAALYAQLTGGWVWTFFWLSVALLIAGMARPLLELERTAGVYGIALSILNAVFAFGGPLYGASYIETVRTVVNRGVGESTALEVATAAVIPVILLILAAFGIVSVLRIRSGRKAGATQPLDEILASARLLAEAARADATARSQTPKLDSLLSILDAVQQKDKKS